MNQSDIRLSATVSAADSDRKATALMVVCYTRTHILIRVNLLSDSKLWRSYTTTVLCWPLLEHLIAALTIVLCSNSNKSHINKSHINTFKFAVFSIYFIWPELLILIFVFYRFLLCGTFRDEHTTNLVLLILSHRGKKNLQKNQIRKKRL